jgi:hypothetical protein
MRRVPLLMFFVTVGIATLLTGCSNGSLSATIPVTNTPTLAPSAIATNPLGTATPSSQPVTPPPPHSPTHTPTHTPTPTSTTQQCGSITATTTASSTTTKPSNTQPLEDCFTNAFVNCNSVTLDITFIDSTGTTEDKLQTPAPQLGPQGCEVAAVQEHKHPTSGGDSTTNITCMAIVPYSGQKYSLRECSDNEFIYLP